MLKRWRATPLPRWCYFAGRTCATLLMALASGAVTVAAGALAYHARLSAGAALSLLVALTLGALAWAGVGTAITAVIPTTDAAQPVLSLRLLPGDAAVGRARGVQRRAEMAVHSARLPARPADPRRRHPRAPHHRHHAVEPPGHDLAVLAGWAIGALLASLRLFQWEPRAPR